MSKKFFKWYIFLIHVTKIRLANHQYYEASSLSFLDKGYKSVTAIFVQSGEKASIARACELRGHGSRLNEKTRMRKVLAGGAWS